MQKNTTIKIPKVNLGYLKSSDNWRKLQSFNNKLINKYINKTEFAYDLEKVEKSMNENVCDDSWMGHCAKYHLQSGGKRFRAILALLASRIFNLDSQSSVNVAVCCEFIHNASLIHDDLQDRDLLRRGFPTIWSRFGDHSAINLGDYFISASFEALTKCKVHSKYKCIAVAELSKIIKQTVRGQSSEILGRSDFHATMLDYESTARAKTGSLLSLPVKLVMLLKGFNQYNEDSLKPLYETGLAYQIQDDISDFLGIKDRGLPGRDLKEGKMNVLIMHYIENASPGEKFLLQEFLKKRFDSISEEEIQHWITQIQKKQGLERSIIHLDKVARKAIELSKKDDNINNIVKFVINRTLNRISDKIK